MPGHAGRTIDLYHFTHVDNLPQVVEHGLLSDSLMGQAGRGFTEVGNREIKANRRALPVTAGPGGCPADYVPFYFATRSPMMFTIWKGNVEHYQDGLEPLVYLVTTVDRITGAGLPFVFSDGNCGSGITDYSDDLGEIDQRVDWNIMRDQIWRNTPEDGDRMRRRMAEFLVHERVPWNIFTEVGTMTAQMAQTVSVTLNELGSRTDVRLRVGWYYP